MSLWGEGRDFFFLPEIGSSSSPGCSGTYYLDDVVVKLTKDLPASLCLLSSGMEGMHHRTQPCVCVSARCDIGMTPSPFYSHRGSDLDSTTSNNKTGIAT